MMDKGYKNVEALKGGIKGWEKAGFSKV